MMYLLYGEVTNMIKEVEAVKQAVGVMVLQWINQKLL
jgi:HAMP domain-containing protein